MKTMFVLFVLFLQSVTWAQVPNWKGKLETKNNVRYVHNPREGVWGHDPAKKMKVTRIFSLGSLNAEEEYLFSWVKDIATDRNGNIYACDSRENRIQVYDKSGKYIRTMGRKGKGPGELLRPMAIVVDDRGKIYVQDDLNKRVSIFKNNGKFYKSFNYKYFGIAGEQIDLDPSGNVLICHYSSYYGKARKLSTFPIVTAYNLKGKVMQKYGKPQLLIEKNGYGMAQYSGNGFVSRRDGTLIVYFSYPYLIHFYKQGQLVKVIDRVDPVFTKPEIMETKFTVFDGRVDKIKAVVYRSSIRYLHILPDGKFIVCI
ncbi:MAG TPA: 6-bladed beta-propeller, partial [Bacteroidetes bacterium]|nr:6-bladed beta-propeller [Bacteroidota bacterium]